jgi:TetR/AcrR family transcriptional regulator, transcriptional repressor for nem operon
MNNTKSKIIEIAKDLIQRVGLNAMSYQHISDAVGIRKASIHHHFPKKENLVDALLKECQVSYGGNYQQIVDGPGSASEKLRQIAGVFEEGLQKDQLCLVGAISTDLNTLQENSCRILEETIQNTVDIFSTTFKQGQEEQSLSFKSTAEEAAYTFFSFLIGTQISARVHGGVKSFRNSTELIISGWEN